jgi:hypothetical protein
MVSAFEGNKAETKTMLPVIESFMAAHDLPDVTVIADAGMVSEANQNSSRPPGLKSVSGGNSNAERHHMIEAWRRAGHAISPTRWCTDTRVAGLARSCNVGKRVGRGAE